MQHKHHNSAAGPQHAGDVCDAMCARHAHLAGLGLVGKGGAVVGVPHHVGAQQLQQGVGRAHGPHKGAADRGPQRHDVVVAEPGVLAADIDVQLAVELDLLLVPHAPADRQVQQAHVAGGRRRAEAQGDDLVVVMGREEQDSQTLSWALRACTCVFAQQHVQKQRACAHVCVSMRARKHTHVRTQAQTRAHTPHAVLCTPSSWQQALHTSSIVLSGSKASPISSLLARRQLSLAVSNTDANATLNLSPGRMSRNMPSSGTEQCLQEIVSE